MSKNKKLEKKKINTVQQEFDRAIKKHNLIEEGDNILIGLSGGIDSLVMTELLSYRKKYFPVKFNLKAVFVNIENIPYKVNENFLAEFCNDRGIDFEVISKKIDIDQKQITTNPCFICSWNRRKILFDYTKQNNFNKLALGHHKEDAIETFLINLIYHGSISSLPVKLSMFSGRMHLIRPLMYLNKEQIKDFAELKNIYSKIKDCKFSSVTKRRKVEKIIDTMKEFNPQVENLLFKAMSKINEEYLPK